jgi:hypothetical protein
MYHFSERAEAHLVGLWALFVFPLAYALMSIPHLFLALVAALIYLALIWFGGYPYPGISETLGCFSALGMLVYFVGVFHHPVPGGKVLARSYASVGAVIMTLLLVPLSFRAMSSDVYAGG